MVPGPPGGSHRATWEQVAQEPGKLNTVQPGADQPCPYGNGSVTAGEQHRADPLLRENVLREDLGPRVGLRGHRRGSVRDRTGWGDGEQGLGGSGEQADGQHVVKDDPQYLLEPRLRTQICGSLVPESRT